MKATSNGVARCIFSIDMQSKYRDMIENLINKCQNQTKALWKGKEATCTPEK
jgi:hypothetical protein